MDEDILNFSVDKEIIDGHLFRISNGKPVELILTGENLASELKELDAKNISSLVVNSAFCRDRIRTLDFLGDCPNVKSVYLHDYKYDVNGLYLSKNLRELTCSEVEGWVDYSRFPSLEGLVTSWKNRLLLPDSLKKLGLWYFKPASKSLTEINFPSGLENLSICHSNIDNLKGCPVMLKSFELSYCRNVSSMEGLEGSSDTLRRLTVENCPHLRDYSALECCQLLEYLILADCREIPSIGFVRNMTDLNHFCFYGTTVMDFDLSAIRGIPSVYFKNDKRYNRRMEDF